MTEEIIAGAVSYGSVAIMTFLLCATKARELWNSRRVEQRSKWARAALWSPLWPLLALYVGGIFMYDMLADLVRWSREKE